MDFQFQERISFWRWCQYGWLDNNGHIQLRDKKTLYENSSFWKPPGLKCIQGAASTAATAEEVAGDYFTSMVQFSNLSCTAEHHTSTLINLDFSMLRKGLALFFQQSANFASIEFVATQDQSIVCVFLHRKWHRHWVWMVGLWNAHKTQDCTPNLQVRDNA